VSILGVQLHAQASVVRLNLLGQLPGSRCLHRTNEQGSERAGRRRGRVVGAEAARDATQRQQQCQACICCSNAPDTSSDSRRYVLGRGKARASGDASRSKRAVGRAAHPAARRSAAGEGAGGWSAGRVRRARRGRARRGWGWGAERFELRTHLPVRAAALVARALHRLR